MSKNDPSNSRDQYALYWIKVCEAFIQGLIAHALKLANGRRSDADDLVQETVCRILMYPKNPEKIRSPFGYLLAIMRNIWITRWRKQGTTKMESLDELLSKEAQQKPHRNVEPAIEPDVLRILENDEHKAELRAKQGPLTSREEFLLKSHLEGYTCKEIAGKLNEDVRLVRVDLNAVRTKVRARLKR
jgi:RNA polymerase sigma factor (sigma-70 family)